jgi:hypothetical protein
MWNLGVPALTNLNDFATDRPSNDSTNDPTDFATIKPVAPTSCRANQLSENVTDKPAVHVLRHSITACLSMVRQYLEYPLLPSAPYGLTVNILDQTMPHLRGRNAAPQFRGCQTYADSTSLMDVMTASQRVWYLLTQSFVLPIHTRK